MRLTLFTDYGLRILMRLAMEPGRRFTADSMADELRLSRTHLSKVIQALRDAGCVDTVRGMGGGFSLARPAEEIGVGAVARRLEGRLELVECFREDGGSCALMPSCRLRGPLQAAGEAFFRELDRLTLADCLRDAALPAEDPDPGKKVSPPAARTQLSAERSLDGKERRA